jgi:hypothetical protein
VVFSLIGFNLDYSWLCYDLVCKFLWNGLHIFGDWFVSARTGFRLRWISFSLDFDNLDLTPDSG